MYPFLPFTDLISFQLNFQHSVWYSAVVGDCFYILDQSGEKNNNKKTLYIMYTEHFIYTLF